MKTCGAARALMYLHGGLQTAVTSAATVGRARVTGLCYHVLLSPKQGSSGFLHARLAVCQLKLFPINTMASFIKVLRILCIG